MTSVNAPSHATPKISVVGLGPAGGELVTAQSLTLLDGSLPVWLRTSNHPAASLAPSAPTFDDVYDNAETIESVYPVIVEALVAEAEEHRHIVYAVPGSPMVAEATVELLRADERVNVEIFPALSFLDVVWARLGVDPLAESPRIVDGRRFATEAAGQRGPLLVAQCDAAWVLSDIKLAFETEQPNEVTVMQRLALPDEKISIISWDDLDRVVEPDHLTTLWIPSIGAPVGSELVKLHETATRLRRDCPWDRDQTHSSLGRHLIEESYELLDAIEATERANNDDDLASPADDHLVEELGDILFQVYAHGAIAEQQGRFNVADIARNVREKLIERHPHVYGNVVAETSGDVAANWESNKKASKGRSSLMEGIPRELPALMYAWKVLTKASTVGVELAPDDIDNTGYGGALMLLVDDARRNQVEPEEALRTFTTAFRLRFEEAERVAKADGVELSTADNETANRYWAQANPDTRAQANPDTGAKANPDTRAPRD